MVNELSDRSIQRIRSLIERIGITQAREIAEMEPNEWRTMKTFLGSHATKKSSVLAQQRLLRRVLREIEQPTQPQLLETIAETWNLNELRELATLAVELANAVLANDTQRTNEIILRINEIQRLVQLEQGGPDGWIVDGPFVNPNFTIRDISYTRTMIDGTLTQHSKREVNFNPVIDKDTASALIYVIVDSVFPDIVNGINTTILSQGFGRFYINIVADNQAVSVSQFSTFVPFGQLDLTRNGFADLLMMGLLKLTSGTTISVITFTITAM